MKLWEMLRDGKVGDRFQCVSKFDSWNGEVYEFLGTDIGCCIRRAGVNKLGTGYLLDMCSAALDAEVDWIKLPKPVVYVDFQEAYRAFMKGSGIQSAVNGYKYKNKNHAISFPTDVISGQWVILKDQD